MIPPSPTDLLTELVAEALTGVMDEAQVSGRIQPRIFYSTGCRRIWSFPARFDDFLAAALSAHRRFEAEQDLLRKIGMTFYTVASTLAAMNAGQPHLLTPEATSWDSTRYVLLRSAGPKFVVIVDYAEPGAKGLPGPVGASMIVAIGLHPAGMAGATATYCPGHPRGFDFDPINAITPEAARARGRAVYIRLFAPEAN